MRYFRVRDEGLHEHLWGGQPTYWLEVDHDGRIARLIEAYPNGRTLVYDKIHNYDVYGGLDDDHIESINDFWLNLEISADDFDRVWRVAKPFNRNGNFLE